MTRILKKAARRRAASRTGHASLRLTAWGLAGLFCILASLGTAIAAGAVRHIGWVPFAASHGRPSAQLAAHVSQAGAQAPVFLDHGIPLPAVEPVMLDEIEVMDELGSHDPVRELGDDGRAGFPPDPSNGACSGIREETLRRQSLVEPVLDGCRVVSGEWIDPWTGRLHGNADDMAVVPAVPFAEAMRSGAGEWADSWLEAYVSDLETPWAMLAVAKGSASERGGRDPASWLPANDRLRCDYVSMWVAVKHRWRLGADAREMKIVRQALAACP